MLAERFPKSDLLSWVAAIRLLIHLRPALHPR